MKKIYSSLEEIKLIGIKVRTSNKGELDSATAKIAPCVQKYFVQQISGNINNRLKPNATYCAYTDYESDYHGEYTFFIGEEVSSFSNTQEGLSTLVVPRQKYVKFTTESGAMPNIVINSWNQIWQMTPEDLGGTRAYYTDFEVYDQRAIDPQNTVLDIYIGIN